MRWRRPGDGAVSPGQDDFPRHLRSSQRPGSPYIHPRRARGTLFVDPVNRPTPGVARRPLSPFLRATPGLDAPPPRRPVQVGRAIADLFAARGLARREAGLDLERAWNAAVGEPLRRRTRVGVLRRGILAVLVDHPIRLEELAAYRKPQLLEALRRELPGAALHDLRFRLGAIEPQPPPSAPPLLPGSSSCS